jgi:hypothetical protein
VRLDLRHGFVLNDEALKPTLLFDLVADLDLKLLGYLEELQVFDPK